MYMDTVPNRSSPPAILLREGWREDGQVKKRTLANLSKWPKAKIDALRRVLKDEPMIGRDEAFNIVRSLPHGHVAAVLGTLRALAELIDFHFAPGEEGAARTGEWCAVLHLGKHFWFYVILWTVAAIQYAPCPPPGLSGHSEAPCLVPVRVTSGYGRGIKTFRHKCTF